MVRGGCAYGQVTRQMIDDLKANLDTNFREIKLNQTELFNHMSSRVPPWVTILCTILGGLVVGLIVKMVS